MTGPSPTSLLALLGGFPDRPDLAPGTLAIEAESDHDRRLVEYTTTAGERVRAWLLTPHHPRAVPTPGIVAIHQDGGQRPYANGKSEPAGVAGDPGLAYGKELCQRGYIVLCPDRFGFESRSLAQSPFVDQFAGFRIQATDTGLDLTEDLFKGAAANALLFHGWTMLGKELFELSRAVDYLAELVPTVDPDRIGAIGHSAGGLLVSYLMYLDPRVAVGCASCGSWLFAEAFGTTSLRPMQGFGTALAVPGMAAWGDTDDVLAGLLPRPYWEHCGDTEDEAADARLTVKARAAYTRAGIAERFRFLSHNTGHTFPPQYRVQAYGWFDTWL
jgi:dienelactone hydrolase